MQLPTEVQPVQARLQLDELGLRCWCMALPLRKKDGTDDETRARDNFGVAHLDRVRANGPVELALRYTVTQPSVLTILSIVTTGRPAQLRKIPKGVSKSEHVNTVNETPTCCPCSRHFLSGMMLMNL